MTNSFSPRKALHYISVLTFILLALYFSPVYASDEGIAPGSPAPPLDVKAWFKGKPIEQLDKGKMYVVEFWATWCGPCRESIPHLTELAKKNPDVTFLGISVWEKNEGDNIKNFVADMGDKMDYTVGWSGDQDGMALSWVRSALQMGIPTSFVVKDGIIEWIGHPMQLDKILPEIKTGSFDIPKAKAAFDKAAIETRREMALNQERTDIENTYKSGKHAEAKEALDTFVKKYPGEKQSAEMFHFLWLANEDVPAWKLKAQSDADTRTPENISRLCSFAIRQTSESGNIALGEYALELALDATEHKDILPLNYALVFYEQTNQFTKALAQLNSIEKILPTLPQRQRSAWLEILPKKRRELQAKMKP